MIALIYAAGSSIRIKKTIKIEHKSLLIIKKKKLIEHQLNWIKKTKVNKIVIVVNSKHQKFEAADFLKQPVNVLQFSTFFSFWQDFWYVFKPTQLNCFKMILDLRNFDF